MNPVLTAPEQAPPAPPPPRPGFFAVAWATFLGYLGTVVLAFPLVIALGLEAGWTRGSVGFGHRGAFYRYDGWSWAAEACLGVLAVAVTAAIVGSVLRSRTGWEVPYGWTFLILFATGYAPVLGADPALRRDRIVSLALAAFLLRWRARPSGAEPLTPLGRGAEALRRAVAIAWPWLGPLMAAYVLGYAATHPLRFDATSAPAESASSSTSRASSCDTRSGSRTPAAPP